MRPCLSEDWRWRWLGTDTMCERVITLLIEDGTKSINNSKYSTLSPVLAFIALMDSSHWNSEIQFCVLIMRRVNAGKTSILQRICETTESPVIYWERPRRRYMVQYFCLQVWSHCWPGSTWPVCLWDFFSVNLKHGASMVSIPSTTNSCSPIIKVTFDEHHVSHQERSQGWANRVSEEHSRWYVQKLVRQADTTVSEKELLYDLEGSKLTWYHSEWDETVGSVSRSSPHKTYFMETQQRRSWAWPVW